MSELYKAIGEKLTENGFKVEYLENAEAAKQYLLKNISESEQVGIGGSTSVKTTGVAEALRERGNDVIWHWPGFERPIREQLETDVYLLSANAITKQGWIVNIDGVGNRVAASIFPKGRVYFVVGVNKLCDGGYEQAVAMIKRDTCPMNARRRNADTPCAKYGKCAENECTVPECMCNIYVALHHPPRGKQMTILLVNEHLGYK